tara:strand:- start:164 stop:361 length:198 start_codon:yes stop_codon:yes gene_type:complete
MIGFCAWAGALLMCLAPFIIDTNAGKMIAISGLVLLTLQAISNKCYNLVLLNIAGIGGYLYALYF